MIGQHKRTFAQPTAAVRNADGTTDLRVTIWYPAAGSDGSKGAISVEPGPPDDPYMFAGTVIPGAPVAGGGPYPVILYSHGHNGSVATSAWFGMALANAGYIVLAPDHPGNNLEDAITPGGALLWWLRAGDLQVALDGVVADPVLGGHVDAGRVGVTGISMGGFTALVALGGIFDGAVYDRYFADHPNSSISPPTSALPVLDSEKPIYPEFLREQLRLQMADHRIPAVGAAFVIAPQVIGLRPESLASVDVPVKFIVGSDDTMTIPEVGAALGASMIPGARLITIPGANHHSFLNLCTPSGIAAQYCDCDKVAEQPLTHRTTIDSALALFDGAFGR